MATVRTLAAEPDHARTLLERAVELRASDVHLDPREAGFSVRMRVDGRFCEQGALDRETGSRLLGRLKVMANLLVYRCDIPQEGRLELAPREEGLGALTGEGRPRKRAGGRQLPDRRLAGRGRDPPVAADPLEHAAVPVRRSP